MPNLYVQSFKMLINCDKIRFGIFRKGDMGGIRNIWFAIGPYSNRQAGMSSGKGGICGETEKPTAKKSLTGGVLMT